MMAQNEVVVVGIDVAKDKVDACIRAFKLRQTWLSTAQGHRKLVAWLRKYQVNKAVMEASGGYERAWARVLREAGIEVRIVDPSGSAASRSQQDGWPRTTRSTRR